MENHYTAAKTLEENYPVQLLFAITPAADQQRLPGHMMPQS